MSAKNATVDMTEGSLLKKIIKFAVPLIIMGWVQILFNAADSVIAGQHAGAWALGSIGATSAYVMFVVWFVNGLSSGVGVSTANDYGAGDEKSLRETVTTAMTSSVLIGIVIFIIGFVLARPALKFLGTPEDVIDGAVLYFKIYLISMPAQVVYAFGSAILRSIGDTRRPMFFIMIAGALNVVLNLLFVIVFHLHIIGVSVATVISQYLSAFLVARYLAKNKDKSFGFDIKALKIYPQKLGRIFKIGLPAAIQGSFFSISDMALQGSVNKLGSLAAAGNAAAISVDGFVFSAINAFTHACTAFVGQNVGAKKYKRANRSMGLCIAIVSVFALILGVIIYLLREPIFALYLPDDPAAAAYGISRTTIVALTGFIYGILEMLTASIRSYGASTTPAVISIVGICAFRVLWALFYFPKHMTMFHLYLSYPIAWVICIVAEAIAFVLITKKIIAKNTLNETK